MQHKTAFAFVFAAGVVATTPLAAQAQDSAGPLHVRRGFHRTELGGARSAG